MQAANLVGFVIGTQGLRAFLFKLLSFSSELSGFELSFLLSFEGQCVVLRGFRNRDTYFVDGAALLNKP